MTPIAAYEADIARVMKENLDQYSPALNFSELWHQHRREGKKRFTWTGLKTFPKIALASLLALIIIGAALKPLFDKTDYPFVNDPAVIGKWQTVDCVETMDQFTPGHRWFVEDFYVTGLVFINQGQLLWSLENGDPAPGPLAWTRGMIINKQDKTAAQYIIKEINGSVYMFMEWKSGDYTYEHRKPPYVVMKKMDSRDYSAYKPPEIHDNIDVPFENDPQLLGRWETVDYVLSISEFEAGKSHLWNTPFLLELDIDENGRMSALTPKGKQEDTFTWTRGLILNKHAVTAGHYEIKDIQGSSYLFFEWKAGDYVYRGQKPGYLVLKKA